MKSTLFNTAIGRLRLAGITEGISFLLLLFIAMPLKYLAGYSEVVKYTGWIHGVLFILYILALINVRWTNQWELRRLIVAFVASLIPFGTFVLDLQWRKEGSAISTCSK